MENKILETKKLTKYFYDPIKFQVLKEIDLSINHGEFVSIVGKSGCGKSTLLYLLSTMDTDYEGQIFIHNEMVKLIRSLRKYVMRKLVSFSSFIICCLSIMYLKM
jgi:ABC-type lipoprotein export system ATPase subunit